MTRKLVRDHPTRKNVVLGGGNGCSDCAFDNHCDYREHKSTYVLDIIERRPVVRCKRKKYPEEIEEKTV